MVDVDRLKEALAVLPGCGHWKDAEYRESWSLRLMDGDAEWRFVCEAIIGVASGQRYCMDEGPRVEPHEIEQWFRAARKVAAGPSPEAVQAAEAAWMTAHRAGSEQRMEAALVAAWATDFGGS